MAGCLEKTAQLFLYVFFGLFMVLGLAGVGLALYLFLGIGVCSPWFPFLCDEAKIISFTIIGLGGVIAIISLIGILGTRKGNRCIIIFCIVAQTIILLIIVAGGLTGSLYYQQETQGHVETKLKEELTQYNNTALEWDNLQKNLTCCGVNGVDDWEAADLCIPESCCIKEGEDCTEVANNTFNVGCAEKIVNNFNPYMAYLPSTSELTLFTILFVAIVGFQLVGIFFLFCFCKVATDEEDSDENEKDELSEITEDSNEDEKIELSEITDISTDVSIDA